MSSGRRQCKLFIRSAVRAGIRVTQFVCEVGDVSVLLGTMWRLQFFPKVLTLRQRETQAQRGGCLVGNFFVLTLTKIFEEETRSAASSFEGSVRISLLMTADKLLKFALPSETAERMPFAEE